MSRHRGHMTPSGGAFSLGFFFFVHTDMSMGAGISLSRLYLELAISLPR